MIEGVESRSKGKDLLVRKPISRHLVKGLIFDEADGKETSQAMARWRSRVQKAGAVRASCELLRTGWVVQECERRTSCGSRWELLAMVYLRGYFISERQDQSKVPHHSNAAL